MSRWDHGPWLLPLSALGLAAGILLGRSAASPWLGGAALLLAVLAVLLLRGRAKRSAMLVAVVALGCVLGYGAYHPALPDEGEYVVAGVIVNDIRLREDGQVRTVLRSVTLDGQEVSGGAYWTFYLQKNEEVPQSLSPGMKVTMRARVYHPSGAMNPGGYDFRENLLQQDVLIGVYGRDELKAEEPGFHLLGMAAKLRNLLMQRLVAVMGQEEGRYAATMVLGSRELLSQDDREAFSRLGIAHILSVSGFHVGVLAGLVRLLMRRLRLSRRLRLAITAVILGGYCLLAGMSAPVLRAMLLYVLWETGALLHRQRSGLHLLSAAWIIILVLSPAQLTSGSFQLSFGAVLGLTLVSPWLEQLHTFRRPWLHRQWRILCAGLGAQAGILLPQLYIFHELSMLGILLNMLVLSAASLIIMLCWITLLVLPLPLLAHWTGGAAAWMIRLLLAGVRAMGSWEGITLWTCQANVLTALGWCVLMAAMSLWWRGRFRSTAIAVSLAVMVLSVLPWPYGGTSYVQFSVGEADCALLRDQDQVVVIDTGEDGQTLSGYLHQRRLSIDALIITHLHSDHAGGMRALLDDGIPVETCYLPLGAQEARVDEGMLSLLGEMEQTGTEIRLWSRGDTLGLPSGSISVLWPQAGRVEPGRDANETSLAMLASLHGTTLLLTGDLDGRYEHAAAVPADILKVAHHGAKDSTSPEFLAAVNPRLLLLSRGNDARRASMEQRRGSIPMLDTEADGAITLEFGKNGFTATTVK